MRGGRDEWVACVDQHVPSPTRWRQEVARSSPDLCPVLRDIVATAGQGQQLQPVSQLRHRVGRGRHRRVPGTEQVRAHHPITPGRGGRHTSESAPPLAVVCAVASAACSATVAVSAGWRDRGGKVRRLACSAPLAPLTCFRHTPPRHGVCDTLADPVAWQTHHNNKVVTLFSASNYCGGDYDGCVLCLRKGFTVEDITKRSSSARFTHNVKPAVTRFQLMPKAAVMAACNGDYSEFVKACLAAEAITGRRDELFAMFSEHDPAASGIVRAMRYRVVCRFTGEGGGAGPQRFGCLATRLTCGGVAVRTSVAMWLASDRVRRVHRHPERRGAYPRGLEGHAACLPAARAAC